MMSIEILVFGSNEGGHHGAGAAWTAHRHHGAELGVAYGLTGNAFAIPTKDHTIRHTLPLSRIQGYVQGFIAFAEGQQHLVFNVTRIGCGLAGLKDEQIAPMFKGAINLGNVGFDTKWLPWLGNDAKYWGTY